MHVSAASEPVGDVVPPGRHMTQVEAGQVRLLRTQQPAHDPLIDVNLGRRNAAVLNRTVRGLHGQRLRPPLPTAAKEVLKNPAQSSCARAMAWAKGTLNSQRRS